MRPWVCIPFFAVLGCTQRSFDRKVLAERSPAQINTVNSMHFVDATHLAVQTNTEFRVWDVTPGAVDRSFFIPVHGHGYPIGTSATSSDARVAALYTKGQIRVTALDTGSEIAVYPALKAGSVLAVTAEGSVVSVESDENTSTAKSAVVRVWKKGATAPLWERAINTPRPWFAVSTNRFALSEDSRVVMLEISTGRELWSFAQTQSHPLNLSADGSKLAIVDRETMILDTESGRVSGRAVLKGPAVYFADDFVSFDSSGWVRRIDSTGAEKWVLPVLDARGSHRPVLTGTVSPDGTKMVLYVEAVMTLELYDAQTGRRARTLAKEGDYAQMALIEAMAISPDNAVLAVAQGKTLLLWKLNGDKKYTALVDPTLLVKH